MKNQYAIIIAANQQPEWIDAAYSRVTREATALTHKIVESRSEAIRYCNMYNQSFNPRGFAIFKKI